MKTQFSLFTSILLLLAILMQPAQATLAAPQPAEAELVFDFTAYAALAQWKSGAGVLPFPGTSGDYRGYAQRVDAPVQEDGTLGAPGLLTVPHNKYDGYIQGIYPEFTVQQGDHFQASVGCEYGAQNCYVTYRLDYINAGGATRVFWTWKEKYEGRYYNADLDLSPLAGKKVRFVLTMLATGSASQDRPLWVAPRIVRPGNGMTPMPTLTSTATPFETPPTVPPSNCERAAFVSDVTVRDGTTFAPGQAFTKTWRLKNTGSCAWTKDYALVFYGGDQMSAPTLVNLPWTVSPGQMVDVTVNAIAPDAPDQYRSDWILRNPAGRLFGIGSNGDKPFWMLINVVGAPPLAETGYDFSANLCAAEWRSGAGILPCPLAEGDSRGFALAQQTRLEDGSVADSAILTQPQNKYNGYIQGTFPTFTIQPGDRFQAVVGCEYNVNCYVTLRLEYLTAGGAPRIFWKWAEKNEGKTYSVDLDLSPLAGQSLRFVLTTLAAGSPSNDRAVWGNPRIIRPGLPVITPTPTSTPTPPPSQDWPLFTSAAYGFQFRYPPDSFIHSQETTFGHIELPILETGTNLTSKYLEYRVVNGLESCSVADTFGPPPGVTGTQEVVINGYNFTQVDGLDAAMNHTFRYTFYTTKNDGACLSLLFMLRAGNPEVFDPPRPVYDYALEASTFTEMINTFAWPALPPGLVTNVTLAANVTSNACNLGPVRVELTGEISADGPATVAYHWEIIGDSVNTVTADQILTFENASTQSVATAFDLPCGSHALRLVVVVPNSISAQVNVLLYPEAPTVTPISPPTVTPISPPTETPTPVFTAPYAVVGIHPEEELNVYAAAGAGNVIVGAFPADTRTLERGSNFVTLEDGLWVEARLPGGLSGWVYDRNLTEYIAPEQFVTDSRPIQLIATLKQAMQNSDGDLFASLVSPRHGVQVMYHGTWGSNPVIYLPEQARQAFASSEVIDWGAEGASGQNAVGTFSQVIQPKLLDVLLAAYELHPNDPNRAGMYLEPWPQVYQNLNYFAVVKPPTPEIELDWRIWLAGFEYVDGAPYLVSLLHYVWEP